MLNDQTARIIQALYRNALYFPLGEEIKKSWHVSRTVILVVIGAMGEVTPVHQMWFAQICTGNNQHKSAA